MLDTDKQTPFQMLLTVLISVALAMWFFIWIISGAEKSFDKDLYNPKCSIVADALNEISKELK